MLLKIFAKPEKFTYLIILISFLGVIYSLQKDYYHKSLPRIEASNYDQQIESAQVGLKSQKLIPTFGFNNLRADITYLQFLQYFGDQPARKQTGYSLVPSYFATVVEYDPNFTQANLSFSVANSMYAGQPEKTVTLMEKILVSSSSDLDDAYLIWFSKGLDELLFLGDTQAAINSYQNSTKSALNQEQKNLNIIELDQITRVNQKKIEYLTTNPDTTDAQIAAWKTVLPNVVEPMNRQRISDRIRQLELKK
ncbi:MAG: hypothetical protein AB4372_07655 [Xenococcus sp. (in: cyanobacteria)]